MPMYEYVCLECDSHFDLLRQMNQTDHDVLCPQCSSKRIERQLSVFATGSRSLDTGAAAVATTGAGGCCGGACGCSTRN
jgi:putative FmdB family regulatory protein